MLDETSKSAQENFQDEQRHVDTLTNNRVTWLTVSQGLLFAGIGQILAAEGLDKNIKTTFSELITLIGMLTCGAILIGILAAILADLIQLAKVNKGEPKGKKATWGACWATTALGWVPSFALPLIFGWGWYRAYLAVQALAT